MPLIWLEETTEGDSPVCLGDVGGEWEAGGIASHAVNPGEW